MVGVGVACGDQMVGADLEDQMVGGGWSWSCLDGDQMVGVDLGTTWLRLGSHS